MTMTMTWQDTIRVNLTLEAIECCSCGVPFAMPADLLQWFRDGEDRWCWCPNGHQQHFAESDATRLKRRLADAEQRLERAREGRRLAEAEAERQRRSGVALKGQLTKARRRAAHGVCPVPDCHRRPFDNLAAHMAAKHPGFVVDADRDAGVAAREPGGVRVDGPYGSMRKRHGGQGQTAYDCACGWFGHTSGGAAARHARTCPRARESWPTKGESS